MTISWIGKTLALRQFISAAQSAASAAGIVIDASIGSITLALGQAVTGTFLWLQSFAIQVLALTRASTSFGTDLDSWMADWFFTRLPAVAATGSVTFARFTATSQAVVPIGETISTGPGGQQYVVTTDTTNGAYNASLNAYVLPVSTSSVTVPITAVVAGSAGNAQANTITSFVSPLAGIDTVTNSSGLTNGADAELDAAFLARFQLYIQALTSGTVIAIKSAVANLQQGAVATVIENQDSNGTADNGMVTIVVDNGTGTPPTSLITAANALFVTGVRAAGVRWNVTAPTVNTITSIALTVTSIISANHAADQAAAAAAILAYVNALPIGATLFWSRLFQVVLDSSSNISKVSNLLINGGTADIVPSTPITVNKTVSGNITVS